MNNRKILLFANTDWYLYNFRLSLAYKLRSEGWEVILMSPPGDYGPKLEQIGFRWIPFPFSTQSTNPLREFGVLLRLILLYRREKPDLLHHFTIKCVLYGSLAAKFAGITNRANAVTGMGHIFTDTGIKARLLRPVVKVLYRLALNNPSGRVIFQNEEDQAAFVKYGMSESYLTRLIRGSGVNCGRFKPAFCASGAERPVRILFASRLLREKGIFELVEAARLLQGQGLQAEFLIAGELYPGNPSSLTKADLEALQNEKAIIYLGHIDNMPALIAKSDIVTLPSYREGTPRILIEAAAMGKPIVATDIAGCRGLVVNGVNGLLVPPKGSQPLAQALKELILSPQQRHKMGAAGRQIVLNEFDEKIVIKKTLAVYHELMAERGDTKGS
ncbi:glycosyltransferase family 4 protein [Desulfopila inferna]|uniref:glycosyltransferase family 4 protein n=1 Tax=Desulfopila inferna TaxID=468528 RepID=UPI001965C46D|nr:glycosyltransferase family 4 protein [Desulfopila inferna]MBM9605796.1 glycosyltransferase family 4 protein [Desulfopila inferna]